MEVGTDRFACSVFDLPQSGAKARVAHPVVAKELGSKLNKTLEG
jgi:hypothetical protein